MNDLQREIADLSEAARWRLLCWLARHYPEQVAHGLDRTTPDRENAADTWRIYPPDWDSAPPACHPGDLRVPLQDGERASERATCTGTGGTQ